MRHFLLRLFALTLITGLLSTSLTAQEGYVPTQENLENREWFQDAKYGLFVHWGVYSIMGGGGSNCNEPGRNR